MELDHSQEIINVKEEMIQIQQYQPRRILNEFKVNIIDACGDLSSKILNKIDLVQITKLNSRDIRVHLPSQPTGLFIRDNCIIINMLHVKMIIMDNQVIIYDSDQGQEIQNLINLIQEKVHQREHEINCPYEFFVLEIILNDICLSIQHQHTTLKNQCDSLLYELLNRPTQKKSLALLPIKHDLKKLEIVAKNICESIDNLLKSDENMMEMCLTNKQLSQTDSNKDTHSEIEDYDHNEIEDLLETYYFEIDKILDKLLIMENKIDETDDTVSMMLDISRNRIMTCDLWINFLTMTLAIGTLISGLFGMNLTNYLEDDSYAFGIVYAIIVIAIVIMMVLFYFHNRLRRMRI